MPDWLYITLLFGIGPGMALGVVGLYYWDRRREDREAWERGQALRRQLREQQAARGVQAARPDAAEALKAALPVLQDYASSNPMHFYRGEWQDPRGVHAAVKLVMAALGAEKEAGRG